MQNKYLKFLVGIVWTMIMAFFIDKLMGITVQANSPIELHVTFHYLLWLLIGICWCELYHKYLATKGG